MIYWTLKFDKCMKFDRFLAKADKSSRISCRSILKAFEYKTPHKIVEKKQFYNDCRYWNVLNPAKLKKTFTFLISVNILENNFCEETCSTSAGFHVT